MSTFLLAALATWRVTHLLASEDGPADLIVRFRVRLGNRFAGKLMDCFNCMSLWIAAPAALLVSRNPTECPLIWLALSGSACLLERVVKEPAGAQPAWQLTEGGINDVLRPETFPVADQPTTQKTTGSYPKPVPCKPAASRSTGTTGFDRHPLFGE
jgi:hypothetical protein